MMKPHKVYFRIALLLVLIFASCFTFAQQDSLNYRGTMGHNHSYGSIGSSIPGEHSMSPKIWGYDISQWQGNVDFSQLKTAASFVVIRAGYGNGGTDTKFAQNRANAEAQGMEIGFYHYAYPEYNSAVTEANSFANAVGHLNPGQFAVLDFEEQWNGDAAGWCKTWLDTVQARLGVRPLIYINLSTVKAYNWSSVYGDNYGLWLAYWDNDKNADPPSTPWPFVAMRQYDDNETAPGITGNVDGDVFYGTLDQLKKYGAPGTPATIAWTNPPASGVWYRSDEHLSFNASGTASVTINELVEGKLVSTLTGTTGYMALSSTAPGQHTFEITASNSYNTTPASTGVWKGGWDPNPPTVTNSAGAQPGVWYHTGQSVSFTCSDALSGIRQYRYKWDDGTFSDWVKSSSGTVQLLQGKHHLYVEAEDNTYAGQTAVGNQATVDLGEYWLDENAPAVKVTANLASSGTSVQVTITVSNPNLSPETGIGFDLIQLGPANASDMAWTIDSLDGSGSASKTFTFPISFGTSKALMLTANYHIGSSQYRFRWRIPKS